MPTRNRPKIAASDQRSIVRHHSGRIASPCRAGWARKTISVIGKYSSASCLGSAELAAGAGFWTYPIPFPPAPPVFHAGSGDSPKIPHVPRAPLFRPAPARLRPRPPEVRRPPQHCRAGSAPFGKPHRIAITVRILGNEGADDEAGLLHHPRVIRRRQTGMIDGQSADTAHRLARVRPAREEERAPLLEMAGEDRKHGPLVVGGEMEETVPGNDAAEAPAEIEMPHVGPDPLAPG